MVTISVPPPPPPTAPTEVRSTPDPNANGQTPEPFLPTDSSDGRGDGSQSGGKSGDAHDDESDGQCSFLESCLGCHIALIVLDVFLIIILIILIILVRRGAKKMKAAMAKNPRKSETMVATEVSKVKQQSKKSHVGTVETKDEGTETRGKDGNVTQEDGTKFYTVDTEFQTPSKKKGKK